MPVPPHPFASSASRKPSRLPIAAALAAVLVGSGIWYATRPELAPIVTTLRMEAQAILAQLEQQWQAREAEQAEQERKGGEAARLAEEQRKNEEALKAERNRQLALARQKEEAARAAAIQNYQRAMALLNQGRSSEAIRLLRQLANDGHGAAAKTLGDLYSSGEKVLLDRQEASRFYAIAERNGVKIDRSASSRVSRCPAGRERLTSATRMDGVVARATVKGVSAKIECWLPYTAIRYTRAAVS